MAEKIPDMMKNINIDHVEVGRAIAFKRAERSARQIILQMTTKIIQP